MISRRMGFAVFTALTAIALIALLALGWRSLDGFESTLARVLQQASVYTAEQTAQQIQRDLQAPVFDLLEQVDHAAIRSFDVSRIAETLKETGPSHFTKIDTYFVWSLAAPGAVSPTAPSSEWVLFYTPSPAGSVKGPPSPGIAGAAGFFSNLSLAATLIGQSQEWIGVQRPFAVTYLTFEGRTFQVIYHYLFDALNRGQLGGIEGFLASAEHVRADYFPDFVSGWRPKALRDPGFPTLAVSILDTEGHEVSRSGRSLADTFDAEASFPFLFFDAGFFESLSTNRPPVHDWTVRIGYESGQIAEIARRQINPLRAALLLAGIVAAVGIALTARNAAREIRLSEMKSEFVASVSHDLKTPLAKIQLYADTLMLGRARSQEKFEAYCGIISVQAKKLSRLIQELMDFSRIEAGMREYAMETLDLGEVLRGAIAVFEQDLSEENCRAEIVIPEQPVHVIGSGEGLHQMFENLISNALKYSLPPRYLRIVLSAGNGLAVVEVTDNGIGVPKRERRLIFRKFYRGAAAAATATGSGIGLAIVQHVVRAHGGTVSVKNAAERGTTFSITLPAVEEREPSEVWSEASSGH